MKAKLQKWKNSNGIRIQSNFLKSLNLKIDDMVILEQNDEKISLKKRFETYKGENLAKDFSWDNPKGKEIW